MKASAARAKTLVDRHAHAQRPDVATTVACVRAGLSVSEFDALRDLLGLSVEDLARRVNISIATLSRRRRSRKALNPLHSDRVIRFARLYRLALDLYDGNGEAARSWLTKPARALDGQTPLNFADTEAGAHEVENLIGRLEYGVYT
jgi:putative toxin-antitoxin system antitoxin component (TIGR02293 family)